MVLPLSISSPSPSSFNLGDWLRDIGWKSFGLNIQITYFALLVLVGVIIAVIITYRRLKSRGADGGLVLDIGLWAFVFGVIGARALHVLTHLGSYFGNGQDPLTIFYVWNDGGMALFGGVALGTIGALIGAKIAGLRFWTFMDAVVPGLLVAQIFARVGDYFNQSNFGLPTDAWFGLAINPDNTALPVGLLDGTLFQPTFFYEVVWDLIGLVLLVMIERKFSVKTVTLGETTSRRLVAGEYRLQWGKLFALYLIWYGIGRSWIEALRVDPTLTVAGLRINTWIAFLSIIVGLIILIVQARRHSGYEASPYLPGREPVPASAVHSDDTYSDADDDGNDAELDTPAASGAQAAEKSVTSGAGQTS